MSVCVEKQGGRKKEEEEEGRKKNPVLRLRRERERAKVNVTKADTLVNTTLDQKSVLIMASFVCKI